MDKLRNYCFISGATGGLGEAFCRQLVKTEKALFLTGRSAEKLEKLKRELQAVEPTTDVDYCAADLSSTESRTLLYNYAINKGYKFSKLVNVAGVDTQKAFTEYDESAIKFQIGVNLEGTLSVTNFVLKHRAEKLKILTVASMSGACPMPYFAIYSATKSALKSFFDALRWETKGSGVTITVAMPGGIPTRADIIKDIEIQGLKGKLSSKPKEFVVKKCLNALEKGKKRVIPGFFNKFVYLSTRLAPEELSMRYVAKNWKEKSKDHFGYAESDDGGKK